ncbi:MAG TPA: transporter substrate-binding domain-containing protein [Myxococcales bacterium]|nr:transporter substrate-binding domain-containing protein [Myxococcales bacterium]
MNTAEVAPGGTLRVGLNYQNFLLVSGDGADGEPRGVAPDVARELARRLGSSIEWLRFDTAGKLFDAVKAEDCDVGFLGSEPQRASEVAFTGAYLEIPVTFLVPAGSTIGAIAEVDRKGVRVAVSERSAYDLYLSRNLKQAEIVRAPGIAASFDWFVERKLEALAGLKPKLVEENARIPGSRLLDGQIPSVQQAIAAPRGREVTARYLRDFVEDVKRSGFVALAIANNGVKGVNVAS